MKSFIALLMIMTMPNIGNNKIISSPTSDNLAITKIETTKEVKNEKLEQRTKKQVYKERAKKRQTRIRKERKEKESVADTSNLYNMGPNPIEIGVTEIKVIKEEGIVNTQKYDINKEKLSEQIQAAIQNYNGKPIIITSGHRHKRKKSKHYHGNAIDIEYDENVVAYLLSEEGQLWLKESKLQFFIEHKILGFEKKMNPKYKNYCRYIAWATGKHIHVETL